jgi:glycogen debranching enzyme
MYSTEEAKANFKIVKDKHQLILDEKVAYYKFKASFSIPSCPDEEIEHAFNGAKMNYLMLHAAIPGVGSGVIGGFPELPWFSAGDFAFGALPMLAVGQFEAVRDTLLLFEKFSTRFCQGEDIPQEITALGAHFMKENLTRLPLLVSALRAYMDWTGDMETVRTLYPLATRLGRIVNQEVRGVALVPEGKGLIDKPLFNKKMLDVSAYIAEGLKDLTAIAMAIGERPNNVQYFERKYQEIAWATRGFWSEEDGLFADIVATEEFLQEAREETAKKSYLLKPDQVREKIRIRTLDPAIFTDESGAIAQGNEGYSKGVFKHWTTVVPLEVGLASPQQADAAFKRLLSSEFLGKYGMTMQAEMDRRGVALASSLLASSLARYGRVDKALEVISSVCATLPMAMPGAVSEYLPNAGNFLHLAAPYALIRVFVHYIMGIRPSVPSHSIEFIPDLPEGWDSVALRNVRIMKMLYDFRVSLSRSHGQISIQAGEFGFTAVMGIPVPKDAEIKSVQFRGMALRVWDYQDVMANEKRYIVLSLPLVQGDNSFRVEWQ